MRKILLMLLLVGVFVSSSVLAAHGGSFNNPSTNWQSNQPTFNRLYSGDFSNYWPILNSMKDGQCNATADFIIGIPPGGCSPAVVTSDLLAEQNVPVFCELYAIKVNPLIKVSSIRSISFKGDYPEGVRSVVYHPARAAVKSYSTLLGSPTLENIGYVVIILKQNKVEANMTEWIAGNLTATMRYDAEEAYGVGKGEYYLERMSDGDWNQHYRESAFWRGRGFLRVLDVADGQAKIQIMADKNRVLRTLTLKEGQTSSSSYLPGFYCRAGLRVKLNDITTQEEMARLNIDGEDIWVRDGTRFSNGKCYVRSLDVRANNDGDISISCTGAGRIKNLGLRPREENASLVDAENINSYFDDSVSVVKDELVESYGAEEKEIGGTWAEEALYQEIILAGNIGKDKTQKILLDLFLEEYPLSKMEPNVREMRERLNNTDFSNSYVTAYVGNEFKSISVVDFKSGNEGNKTVSLRVGGIFVSGLKEKGKNAFAARENGLLWDNSGTLTIDDISAGKVRIIFNSEIQNPTGDEKSWSGWINEGDSRVFDGRRVSVENINVKQVAHVSLIPDVKYEKSEADFSFGIGVEKRAIKLSPEKAESMVAALNVTIEKWEGIVERLGKVVTGLKGACFATSAVLMIKNLASGAGGAAVARTKVMGEYKEICDTQYSDMTRTACYNELSDEIGSDVTAMTAALNEVNGVMEGVQGDNIANNGGLFGGKGIGDNEKYLEDLRNKISADPIDVNIGEKEIVRVSKSELYSVSQVRAVLTWEKAKNGGGVVSKVAKDEMDDALRNVALSVRGSAEQFNLEKQFVFGDVKLPVSVLKEGQGAFNSRGFSLSKSELSGIVSGELGLSTSIEDGDMINAQIVHAGSVDYLYLFDKRGAQLGIYEVEKAGNKLSILKEVNKIDKFEGVGVRIVGSGSCSNPWNRDNAKISYYESGDNKGLPAIVPFDLDAGWYAMVPNSGGTFLDDTPQGYTASADVRYFKICNIGPNGLMQNCAGDDLVQSFSANTAESVKSFAGCNIDTGRLYDKAREAIRRAAQQYGDKRVSIFDEMIDVGRPMSAVGGFECQDFMSPEDCKLMFNVCDPVICPPSRCDLGGKFPVADVIQTGIIGSLALCLPNADEGILIPVCLSGVQAGLDSYVSILKSEKDCLETNLENGELVGICDEITSVYKCEFFWRQMSPLLDQLIPGVLDFATGGSKVRGGGEYALTSQAYNTMKQSVSFFKDTYAQNAFRAFSVRSTQDVGSQVCKSFVGTSVPGSANFIEDLLAPESPTQFYAQFSEKTFTEATVPATSQYKVYYNIYAGNDQGVQYRIYLKNPPAASYYALRPEIYVKSGYIATGSSADESIDFTAPSGYKELCVVINAREECGFKQVTSSFGLDYLTKKAVEEQATAEDIQTEKECISGSPSALSMANLNLAAGADEVINPNIEMRGIIRVCASSNPDGGVAEGTRWKDVGQCGDVNLRCWLDTDSVKGELEALEAIDGASISVLDERRGWIKNASLDLKSVAALLSKAREDIKLLGVRPVDKEKALKIVKELDKVIGTNDAAGAGTNNDRAEALSLKASIWRLLVGEVIRAAVPPPIVEATVTEAEVVEADVGIKDNGTVSEVVPEDIEDLTEIEEYIISFEDIETIVYDIGGKKHIGVGHQFTEDSRAIFFKLFSDDGYKESDFEKIVNGEMELKEGWAEKLLDYELRETYLPTTRRLFPSYDEYPESVKKALVNAVYRGEMKSEHRTVRLISGTLSDLSASDGIAGERDRWLEIEREYLNRNDYRASKDYGILPGLAIRMDANAAIFREYALSFAAK